MNGQTKKPKHHWTIRTEEKDFPLEEELTIRIKETGKRITLKGMNRKIKLAMEEKRKEDLKKPVDEDTCENGQGVYLEEAKRNRSLISKMVWKEKGFTKGNRGWIRKVMMNNMWTRDQRRLHPKEEEVVIGDCPVCLVRKGEELLQTKEHIIGGQCCLTADHVETKQT